MSKKPFLLEYDVPLWSPKSNTPPYPYYLEVLRNHQSVDTIPLDKHAVIVLGREASLTDITIANPSISRQHCIIQYRSDTPKDARLYLYDLKSANGTFWNKKRVKPFTYIPLRLGDQLQFGASNTIYVVASQHEWVQQFNEERLQEEQEYLKRQQKSTPHQPTKKRKEMNKQDSEEDEDDEEHEEADFDEDDLDVRKRSRIEDNYYDTRDFDDEQDEFFDRVGVTSKRMDTEQEHKSQPQVETLETLLEKREKITNRILELKKQMQTKTQMQTFSKKEGEEDALDAYMNQLQQVEQKQDVSKMQMEIDQLETQKGKLNKLITIATPSISILQHASVNAKSKKIGTYLHEMDLITDDLLQPQQQ